MKKRKLGIIGGSGLYKMEGFEKTKWKKVKTAWGKPSDEILIAKLGKEEICFIPRHSRGHKINPTNINFRANIDAFKQLGVTDIISVSAVGSLKDNLEPGKFVIIDQFIDRTFAREKTFFDEEIVAHVSMALPTSKGLMNACEEAIKKEDYGKLLTIMPEAADLINRDDLEHLPVLYDMLKQKNTITDCAHEFFPSKSNLSDSESEEEKIQGELCTMCRGAEQGSILRMACGSYCVTAGQALPGASSASEQERLRP